MQISPHTVAAERTSLEERTGHYVGMINEARDRLADHFEQDVAHVSDAAFRGEVDTVFADGDRAVNVATFMRLLRELDVADDYPGFIVDELLGRRLAATIAGGQPRATLAEATFHFIDVGHEPPGATAGGDDLEAGIAAGFQTRLPGWPWQDAVGPFDAVE